MTSVIYQILNIANGDSYVGQAVNKNKRLKNHKCALASNTHKNQHLQNAWNLFGKECFVFNVLEIVSDVEDLTEREQYWMDVLKPRYNKAPAAGSALGYKHTEETRAKLSLIRKGKKRSEEFKIKISKILRARIVSDEARANMAKAQTGKKHSEETKAKRALTLIGNKNAKGVKQSYEHIEARASVLRGIPKSEEQKAKMSASQKGRVFSEETRKKMSIAAKKRRMTA